MCNLIHELEQAAKLDGLACLRQCLIPRIEQNFFFCTNESYYKFRLNLFLLLLFTLLGR